MPGSASSWKHLGDAAGAAVLSASLAYVLSIHLCGGCDDSARVTKRAYLADRGYLGYLEQGVE